jgi:fluoroquinolone transport system permease protein
MTRLLAVTRFDLRLQWRYGFYYAGVFVTLVWLALLWGLPASLQNTLVPLVIFVDLALVGFYFIAGTVLFEKGERTLAALTVTPLRFGEYLASKLITLTALAVIVSLVVALLIAPLRFDVLLLVLGVLFAALLSLLAGFLSVLPYTSISSYLMPSQLWLLPLALPLLAYLGWWDNPLLYLLPNYGSLLLLQGAFIGIAAWQVAYAVLYQAAWIGLLVWWSRRAFERHILQGGH